MNIILPLARAWKDAHVRNVIKEYFVILKPGVRALLCLKQWHNQV
jgi:hypothetical protein